MNSRRLGTVAPLLLFLGMNAALTGPSLIARWALDDGAAASGVPGVPEGKVIGAVAGSGHAGGALKFEDWSTRNYLNPNPAEATRVIVAHDAKLNPPLPFRLAAWIYPTADPVYMGGIVEKGQGYGSSYRLVLLRGLKLEGCLGERHVCVRSAAPVGLDAWHEVALQADGRTLTLTIDGAVAGSVAIDAPPKLSSTEPVVIGERFTGSIDEVSISAN